MQQRDPQDRIDDGIQMLKFLKTNMPFIESIMDTVSENQGVFGIVCFGDQSALEVAANYLAEHAKHVSRMQGKKKC